MTQRTGNDPRSCLLPSSQHPVALAVTKRDSVPRAQSSCLGPHRRDQDAVVAAHSLLPDARSEPLLALDDQQVPSCMESLRHTLVSETVPYTHSHVRMSCNWSTLASRYHIGTASAVSPWTPSPTFVTHLPPSTKGTSFRGPARPGGRRTAIHDQEEWMPCDLPRGIEGIWG